MMKLLLAGLALFWLGVSAVFAQGTTQGQTKPKSQHTAPIIELLQDAPTPARDRRLYDLAVKLFKAVEDGTEARPTEEAYAVMARALHTRPRDATFRTPGSTTAAASGTAGA